MRDRVARDRGAGVISSAAGVLVFLMFLVFAVQLLFALYATSMVTAVANDAAQRAAVANPEGLGQIESSARATLGRIGEQATFSWSRVDTDGDDIADTLVLRLGAEPPRLVPRSIGEGVGLGPIERTVRVRIEGFDP